MYEVLNERLPIAAKLVRSLYDRDSGGYFIPPRDLMRCVEPQLLETWRRTMSVQYDCVEAPVADFLFELAYNMRCKFIVETGTSRGFSSCHLASAIDAPDGKLITIDPSPAPLLLWKGSELEKKITHVPAISIEVANNIREFSNGAEFDMLFLDSLHSYHNLGAEFSAFERHLKVGGIAVFHDTFYYDGLGLVVHDILANPRFEVTTIPTHRLHTAKTRCPGITVVRKLSSDYRRFPIRHRHYKDFEDKDPNSEHIVLPYRGNSRDIHSRPIIDVLADQKFSQSRWRFFHKFTKGL